LARRRYGPLLPAFRLIGVTRRMRGNPAAMKDGLRASPLIALGAVAWSLGLARVRS
jgi:hypothetical protein